MGGEKIVEEGGLVIGGLMNIKIISELFSSRIDIEGYVLPYNVYRYKKLKRIESIINERENGFSQK